MAFDDKKLSRKERKEIEAKEAREQAEWDAKFAAKQERKKIVKIIEEVTVAEKEIMQNAAAAKAKGYTDVYAQQLSALKIARARRVQAEKFLFQIDSMEKMKSIADSSSALLSSMGNIMNTLGKLSMNKDEIRKSQQDFMHTQQNLNRQSMTIDQVFGQMEMSLPDDDELVINDSGNLNSGLEDEIQALLDGDNDVSATAADPDVAKLQQMLGM